MPSVIGMSLSTAREVISSAITDPQVTSRYSDWDAVPPGTVLMQRPAPGLAVTPDSQVQLTVSIRPTAGDLPPAGP